MNRTSRGDRAFALVLVVAVPISWLAWLAWHGDPRTEPVELLTGILQGGWIVIELAPIFANASTATGLT